MSRLVSSVSASDSPSERILRCNTAGIEIWRIDRKGDGWSEPVWLDAIVNSDVFIDFASIAGDGTLYFMK